MVAGAMGLTATKEQNKKFVFFDLGSGVGKVAVQAYIEFPAVVSSKGVELSYMRRDRAYKAWRMARSKALELRERAGVSAAEDAVSVDEVGDLFEPGSYSHSLMTATHIYVSSTCFPEKMLGQLARGLEEYAPKLEVIASLRPFPDGLDGFEQTSTVEAEMSWTVGRGGTNTVHIYRRLAGKVEL